MDFGGGRTGRFWASILGGARGEQCGGSARPLEARTVVVFQETSWFSEDASGNGFPTETVDVSRGDNADFNDTAVFTTRALDSRRDG